jgi:hypothetical protein
MRRDRSVLAAATIVITFVLAACAPGDDATGPTPGASAPTAGLVATGPSSDAPACGDGSGVPVDLPGWELTSSVDPAFVPVLVSSLVTVGPNRFLYNVVDATYRQLAAPNVASETAFYALERDPEEPVVSSQADYLSSGLGRGLYRTAVSFDCAGEWGAEVSVHLPDGSTASQRLRFMVHPAGTTPAIGAQAPRSDSPTATTAEAVAGISTDTEPYLPAYARTVAQAVTSGRPSLVFFATPAFCQTGFCGPTVELVKSVAVDYVDEVEFVNVEPYQLQVTADGLRPTLDERGQLVPVQAAIDYGIPVEPYLFVVDAAGDVYAKFEGVIGGDELRAAIEDVLAA